MQAIWILLIAATGASPAPNSRSGGAVAGLPVAQVVAPLAADAGASSTSASQSSGANSSTRPAERDAKTLRRDLTSALRAAGLAKDADRGIAIGRLVALFQEIGASSNLPAPERLRMGAELRNRLTRFDNQFHSELAKLNRRSTTAATSSLANSTQATSSEAVAALAPQAAGGPAAQGLDRLIDVIESTISPSDWVLAQRAGAFNQGPGAGNGGGQQAGGAGNFQQMTDANGQALADLIRDTMVPDSWDVRGGPGTIVYFGPAAAMVVRQTGDVHDQIGGLIGALGK